jgi:hypothetical protein
MSTNIVSPTSESHISNISIGLKRLYDIAQYENLEIRLHLDEQINWSSLEDREAQLAALVSRITDDFATTQVQVMSELGVEEKRAWMRPKKAPSKHFKRSEIGDELLG